jgi:hypothetical protein
VLLGVAVAAYLVLSLFDHAARADAGSIDQPINQIGATDPVASVKTKAAGARKAITAPKSTTPRSTARKARPQKIHRSTSKMPEIHAPRVHAPSIRAGETVRRVQVRTSKPRQPTYAAARHTARATVTSARTAVVRQKLPAPVQLPSPPELAALPDLPPTEFPGSLQLSGLLQAQLPPWPQLPALVRAQLPSWPQPSRLPQFLTPVLTRTAALPGASMPPVPAQVCPLSQPPTFASAPWLSGTAKPPAAQAKPLTAPRPAAPRQPADRSTPAGQARDTGDGHAPAMGTVSSSWRPEAAVAGRRLATDLAVRGRTVRYAGPPS